MKHYIEQCSLCVTDFSSFSFDFIFQNKPALFYLIDYKETFDFYEKPYLKNFPKDPFIINNTFYDHNSLIDKIKYYVKRNFKLENDLKQKYDNVFYFKNNLTQRVVDVIDKIIQNNTN